jgi:uncharacterized membrane protein YjgN (DUF898 family)
MKNYFGFTLTGKRLLPIWLIFYILFFVPYIMLILKMQDIHVGSAQSPMIFLYLFILILIAFSITFYIAKILIENVLYKDKTINFNGNIGKFAGVVLLGLFLSIITLGIYLAWFIRDLHRFFVNSSQLDAEPFSFKGKGGRLFVIILLTIFLPIIALAIIMSLYFMTDPGQVSTGSVFIQQVITWIIMIPYMYLVYKWMVDIEYKNYRIKWETDFWNSCGKIALEILLSVITIGIYSPMAMLKLYKYFTERTIAQSGEISRKFGFDDDHNNDFLFLWGQILLTIITLGIYYPWAISKIGARILNKTYLE